MAVAGEITVRERIQFASGDFFVGGGASLLSVLYLIFLTDVVKLAPGLAGTAVLVAKLWDAVNDPLTGSISDRVRTRWGRRRPFIFVGALLLVPVMAAAGFLSGMIMPSRDMLVRAAAPPGQAGAVFGVVSTGFNLGGMAGPPLFGWLLDAGEPRVVFFAAAAFMLLTSVMALAQEWRLARRRRLLETAPAE